jgi:hypothetical protein
LFLDKGHQVLGWRYVVGLVDVWVDLDFVRFGFIAIDVGRITGLAVPKRAFTTLRSSSILPRFSLFTVFTVPAVSVDLREETTLGTDPPDNASTSHESDG